jgi:hypothetical protein
VIVHIIGTNSSKIPDFVDERELLEKRRQAKRANGLGLNWLPEGELVMIAMQYSFVLPADYDMNIVDRRIVEKGPLLDNFPNLRFKAYLTARRDDDAGGEENLYAPFYLWNHADGLNDFVCGDGFAAVSQSFGWPQVKTWIVWRARLSADIARAAYATREIAPVAPRSPLGELRKRESEVTDHDVENGGALASVAAFEPTTWTRVRFRLWGDRPAAGGATGQKYHVGHLSLPAARGEI